MSGVDIYVYDTTVTQVADLSSVVLRSLLEVIEASASLFRANGTCHVRYRQSELKTGSSTRKEN